MTNFPNEYHNKTKLDSGWKLWQSYTDAETAHSRIITKKVTKCILQLVLVNNIYDVSQNPEKY